MDHAHGAAGARNFQASGDAYDRFMGRYSRALAPGFLDFCGVAGQGSALDVGSGPGAVTTLLAERLGPAAVSAVDPSPRFVAECRSRHPGVDVREGAAEALPFADDSFEVAVSQLVLHFTTDAPQAAREMRRTVRPGGTIGACVWDFDERMQMLRAFWDCALALDADAPDEARTVRYGRPGEIAELFSSVGLVDVADTTLSVSSEYADFDELWAGFELGVGPAGGYCVRLGDAHRTRLRELLFERIGAPTGAFTLDALARAGRARVPR